MLRVYRRYAVIAVIALLGACNGAESPTASTKTPEPAIAKVPALRPVVPANASTQFSKPILREMLPDSAYAYVRIPTIWGVMGTPTGSALLKAEGSQPYRQAVEGIHQGFVESIIPELPEQAQAMAQLLLKHIVSPLEIAVLDAPGSAAPIPNVMITAKVDFADGNALNEFVKDAAAQEPGIALSEPAGADGSAVVSVSGFPVMVQLDAANSRLYALLSTAPAPNALADARKALLPNPAHPMLALEKTIDTTGQGLFAWVNPPKLIALSNSMGNAGAGAMLTALGLNTMKNLALGVGSSEGAGRMKVVMDMPQTGFRAFIPVVHDLPAAQAAGAVRTVGVLALPSAQDLAAIESGIALSASPKAMQDYRDFKQRIAEQMGYSIEDLLAALGQDLSFISDEAGQYFALRIRDGAKFKAIVAATAKRKGASLTSRVIHGKTINHLVMPPFDGGLDEELKDADPKVARWVKRFANVPSHVYWVQEGDYLYYAGLPQPLIDRDYIAQRTSLSSWLASRQHVAPDGSVLLLSTREAGLPSLIYTFNLQMLSLVSDLVDRPLDLFDLPTAREAGIPAEGAVSVKLTSSEQQLAFEVDFDSTPAETLLTGGGVAAVAAAGIMAGVAIPAYQDYTMRAKVAAGISAAVPVRSYLAQFVAKNQRYPTAAEIATLDLAPFSNERYGITIEPDDGRVVVQYHDPDMGAAHTLWLTPAERDGTVVWRCSSDMKRSYLPKNCR